MLIRERDRATVEGLLLAARERDGRVAEACRAAGARLDGADDLYVLCAVDDALARVLPDAEHPLYRPVSFRPRIGRSRPTVAPAARSTDPGDVDAIRVDVDRLLASFLDPLDELRWPGGGRSGVERIARGIPDWDRHAREHLEACLAAVRVGPEGRAAMQRRARRLAALPREAELVEALIAAVARFAEAHGASPRALEGLSLPPVDGAVFAAIERTPDEVDEARRRWLAAEAERVRADPHLLRVRSRVASELAGVAPPWTARGPASLAEALDAWRQRFGSPHDLDRAEIELRSARLRLAGALAEEVEAAHAALATGPRGWAAAFLRTDARAVLDAAMAVAGASDRPGLERLVIRGGLSPDAVEAAIRRLSDAVA